jgi:hypothetical protein
MPQGNRQTPTSVTIEYEEYAKNNVGGYTVYTFYVKGSNYLELPLDANVREPTKNSLPYKGMVWTLESNPQNFFLENSGISVIASEVNITTSTKKVKFTFPPGSGIVNGGHTQLAILDIKRNKDISDAILRLEVIEKTFSETDLAIIAASRNTASNVKPYSIAEKKGLFFKIKQNISQDFEKHIMWWENRPVPNNVGMPAPDLIALINLFNVKKYRSNYLLTSTEQPNKSATSKNAVFKEWMQDPGDFEHVYPLINDIIRLRDYVQAKFNLSAPRGFTTLKVISDAHNTPPKLSMFLGEKLTYSLPIQFLLPILASLRADVYYIENSSVKEVGWYENPITVFDKVKPTVLKDLMNTYRTQHHNVINQVSKDANLWRILYDDVNTKVNKGTPYKKFNVP